MAYAALTDLENLALPATALGNLQPGAVAGVLQWASDRADAYFRARWGAAAVPLLAWDSSITDAVAAMAAYRLLRVRGYRSTSGADKEFRQGYLDACEYLDRIQRQQAHPLVTLANVNQPGTPQPNFTSTSVVNLSSGGTAPTRGW